MERGSYGFEFKGPYSGTLEDLYVGVTRYNTDSYKGFKVKKKDKNRAHFVCTEDNCSFQVCGRVQSDGKVHITKNVYIIHHPRLWQRHPKKVICKGPGNPTQQQIT